MRPTSLDEWWPSNLQIIAHLAVTADEVVAISEGAAANTVDSDQDDIAVFRLDSGIIVALVRVVGNATPGFSLASAEQVDGESVLADFLNEAGLRRTVVVWRPDDSGR